jgi:mono/diheme cytochrome c family protein
MLSEPQMRSLASLSSTELIALKVVLSGAATPPPPPTATPALSQGQILFQNKCASCHGGMRGRSASAIRDAINNVSAMRIQSLMSLTDAELQMIADAIR